MRPMELGDVSAVTTMIRDSFEPALYPYMAFTQEGIGNFLSVPLLYRGTAPDNCRFVAWDPAEPSAIRGFADFRTQNNGENFLSYICVPDRFRGEGIATFLIDSFAAGQPTMNKLSLDVFRENASARSLYEKLGFTYGDATVWITKDLQGSNDAVTIPSLAMSVAAHHEYGFSEMNVILDESEFRVGRLGERVLRCFTIDEFENDRLLAGLCRIFPDLRHAFAIVPESFLPALSEEPNIINRSERMVREYWRTL